MIGTLTDLQVAVLDALPCHVALVDSKGIIIAVNLAWRDFAQRNGFPGLTYGVGQSYLRVCELAQGDDAMHAQVVGHGLRNVLAGDLRTFSHEYPCHAPDVQRWFLVTVMPLSWDRCAGAVLSHSDITTRKLAEMALQESEDRFLTTFDHAPFGVAHLSLEGEFLRANTALCSMFGYTADELCRLTIHDLGLGERNPYANVAIQALMDGAGQSRATERRFRHKHGEVLWMNLVVTPITNGPAGSCLLALFENITLRKNAEDEARQTQSLLRMSGRLGRIGAWAVDLPTNTVIWSEEIRQIHEVSHDFVPLLETALEFYPVEYRPLIVGALEQCRDRGLPFDLELQIITAKGRRLWVHAIGEAVRNDQGDIQRIQGAFQDISERKRIDEEYRRIAESLTSTLESITEAFYTLDRSWRFTYVNQEAEQILRHTRSQLLGRVLWDVFPEARTTSFYAQFSLAMRGDAPLHITDYYAPFNGWFEAHLYPCPQGLTVYIRDITDQHRAREALRLSEERFRLVSLASNDALWDWDQATRTMWRNERFGVLFGYSHSDIQPTLEFWSSRIHEDDRQRVLDGLTRSFQDGSERWADEYRFRHHDGSYARVSDRGYILRDANGSVARMIGAMSDITKRKLAEERLAEQAALLDEAHDAITVMDLEHGVTYINRSAERLYGWKSDEIIGRSVRYLLYDSSSAYDHAIRQVLEHGEWRGELSPFTKDGRALLVESHWTLIRKPGGAGGSILCISTDIAEQRRLEEQFLRAQRMESIGTLAGGIAHDLNNVLTPIVLSISLLKRGEEDGKRLRTLEMIHDSAQRGADMVKQVLSFARGVEGKRLSVKIRHLFRDVEKIIHDTFLKSIAVRIHLAPNLWQVTGDPTQLHQVLLNLCVNARDAMPDGGTITLTAENQELDQEYVGRFGGSKPGPYVVIGVEDTGTGIAHEIIDKIFEPFFTTKQIGKGTGLGLSTSLAVVKSHGGFLRVHSEPGKGTAFHVYLPAQVAAHLEATTNHDAPLPHGNGELVLVVDDEAPVRQLTRQTLEAFGYRVLVAADGSEAIALFATQQDSITLVIIDVLMPDMDGMAVMKVLRKIRPSVAIIASSGLNDDHLIEKATDAGAKQVLVKPYDTGSLLRLIEKTLAKT